jgi:hypothetical protein
MTGPYDRADVVGDEVVRLDKWQGPWTNQKLTRVIVWLVVKVPRGPVKGFHVAPQDWFIGLCVKFFGSAGIRKPDLPVGKGPTNLC